MRVHDVRCSLGTLLDLSMGGCLVRRSSAPKPDEVGAHRNIWIDSPCGGRLHLSATLLRHTHAGFRKHELGYSFVDLTPEQREKLCDIARSAVRYEMGFGKKAG